ncbi:hypothetical protein Tco_1008239 [Tanacetum coccineum]
MTLDIQNWSSSVHQEIHKIVKDEIFHIVNQVDTRVQNFKILFLKEAAKFVRDFKSLAKEADESLTKHKALELEIERLLRAGMKRISEKRTKNQAKTDKTEHGMEKRGKDKVKSKPKSTKVKVNPEKSKVKSEDVTEEYLIGSLEPI